MDFRNLFRRKSRLKLGLNKKNIKFKNVTKQQKLSTQQWTIGQDIKAWTAQHTTHISNTERVLSAMLKVIIEA
jgi:hypothetical protein